MNGQLGKTKHPHSLNSIEFVRKVGRGEWIRTTDPSVPNRVLYQAEPRPDTKRERLFYLNLRRQR
jgi:hypothetical protein